MNKATNNTTPIYHKRAEQRIDSAKPELRQTVADILKDVRENGIKAVRIYLQ